MTQPRWIEGTAAIDAFLAAGHEGEGFWVESDPGRGWGPITYWASRDGVEDLLDFVRDALAMQAGRAYFDTELRNLVTLCDPESGEYHRMVVTYRPMPDAGRPRVASVAAANFLRGWECANREPAWDGRIRWEDPAVRSEPLQILLEAHGQERWLLDSLGLATCADAIRGGSSLVWVVNDPDRFARVVERCHALPPRDDWTVLEILTITRLIREAATDAEPNQ